MRALMFRLKKNALLSIGFGGLFLVGLSLPLGAAAPKTNKHHAPATEPAATGAAVTIDLLAGIRSGQLTGVAEGTGDGRMIVSITNKTNGKLRVVLPPGLIASGATGQFGGGMGGMGGGMGGGGGGMGGGMGGGGMGGGMGGGRGGMGGSTGGSSRGGGTMPAMMGMMMLGRLIMGMVGDRDSWDQRSLMQGMSGGMGGGMGGMGGGMGGMGGGMGGMGGGFRSVPATGLLEATLQPRQERQLPTSIVSMNGPNAQFQPLVPAKGEKLQLGGIDQWTDDARTRAALKRLSEAKAPQTVAQMVVWYVTAGASWDDIGRLSQGWGNASEIALARQFVADLGKAEGPSPRAQVDPGLLYWEIKAVGARNRELADGLRVLWGKYPVLGLSTKEGVPATPGGPALACRLEVSDSAVGVSLSASHPSGSDWISLGTFPVKLPDPKAYSPSAADADAVPALTKEAEAARLGDAVADAMLGRLVRIHLSRGPKVKGKDTFRVKIVNNSPLLVNGLALGGADAGNDAVPSVLAGLSLPPLKSLTVPASAEMVERLHLKDGVRVHAANLSGL